jgi:hypothetical protein
MFPVDIVSFTQLCEGIWSSSKKINDQQPFQLLQFKNKKFKKFKKIRSGGGFRPKQIVQLVCNIGRGSDFTRIRLGRWVVVLK